MDRNVLQKVDFVGADGSRSVEEFEDADNSPFSIHDRQAINILRPVVQCSIHGRIESVVSVGIRNIKDAAALRYMTGYARFHGYTYRLAVHTLRDEGSAVSYTHLTLPTSDLV